MAEGNSSIRFKRGDVEFELTASPEDVAKAWTTLEEVVVEAFKASPAAPRPRDSAGGNGSGGGAGTQRRSPRRRATSAGAERGSSAAEDTRTRIREAELADFPELGDDPSALMVGYATLRWARDKLNIDELTAQDIYEVAHERLRVPHTVAAYRNAFRTRARAVHKNTGQTPQTFKLMNPGDQALDAFLGSLEAGGTSAEAEAQAAEAEAEADA